MGRVRRASNIVIEDPNMMYSVLMVEETCICMKSGGIVKKFRS